MDQSYSESDISLSPSKILERLQVLRQLQLLQRGKLQKQHLEYQETSSSLTEIVSHFSNSTSYNTFRSLLETPDDSSNDATPRLNSRSLSPKLKHKDLIEGISVLNLSQESEFIVTSPMSSRSRVSAPSRNEEHISPATNGSEAKAGAKKHISLDEMPVLTPKKDFEALIVEKLKSEINKKVVETPKQCMPAAKNKRPFLKRGQGTSRFGVQKKDLIIQNTKSLPWRQKSSNTKTVPTRLSEENKNANNNVSKNNVDIKIIVTNHREILPNDLQAKVTEKIEKEKSIKTSHNHTTSQSSETNLDSHSKESKQGNIIELPKGKHPLLTTKGKTWASVLNKDQNDFLRQLKQTDYYKNFASPAKSTVSDVSCDDNLTKLRMERENAEQNMFELLERKVSHESFNLENSFFNRFLRRSQLECSGESTPIVMQQCLANNPNLMTILPNLHPRKRNEHSHTDTETNSEYTDCCSDTCSSVSSCCSCKTVEESTNVSHADKNRKENGQKLNAKTSNKEKKDLAQKSMKSQGKEVDKAMDSEKDNDGVINDSEIKANMVEMNAKLIATSELLKDRLCELEDEIETFRKENANLTKMREEIDAERHKFYEEKSLFEQKFNEEKILSEYYLAEEKEKMIKQKQMYEKYVKEMRGRLSKKEKDEVVHLKKEINELKEDIRLKDAKYTSTIARLRNQIKLMEKEKKCFQDEIEKLKKENRRIEHKNDMTRRMSNIKYLEEINKKLSNMNAKETQSEVNIDSNAKYKAFEIERQSRPRKIQTSSNKPMRTRAKSVPNLKVTSRYAKYFSQRDVLSDMERNNIDNVESLEKYPYTSDNSNMQEDDLLNVDDDSVRYTDSDNEDDNNLEKLYMERFHSLSPTSVKTNCSNPSRNYNVKQTSNSHQNSDKFFISKSTSKSDSRLSSNNNFSESQAHRSRSPASVSSQRSSDQRSPSSSCQDMPHDTRSSLDQISNASHNSNKSHNLSKSPVSILTNRSSSSQKQTTVIHQDHFRDTFNVSPEPTTSKTSVSKTNLNPTEVKKPDGSKELRFPNGNVKFISSDGKYSKFVYYNGDVKENFYSDGRIKYFYADTKTCHTTHADGLEVLEFPDGQIEKRYKDGSSEIRLPNGSVRYFDPKNEHVREEWRFPDGTAITVAASGEQRIVFSNGQVEVHADDHKRREFPDGTVKLVYNDGTSETRYASGRVRIKDKHGNLLMDSASR